jgi:hypothetical protein
VGRVDRGAIDFTGATELAFNKQYTDSPALVALTESRAALIWINKAGFTVNPHDSCEG